MIEIKPKRLVMSQCKNKDYYAGYNQCYGKLERYYESQLAKEKAKRVEMIDDLEEWVKENALHKTQDEAGFICGHDLLAQLKGLKDEKADS